MGAKAYLAEMPEAYFNGFSENRKVHKKIFRELKLRSILGQGGQTQNRVGKGQSVEITLTDHGGHSVCHD